MAFAPHILSQQDPQWKSQQLGFDNTITIGTDGCALTCLTMLVNGYGFSETPASLDKKLADMGPGVGFLGGLIVWGALTQAFPRIAYQRIIVCPNQPAPLTDIDNSLAAGQPVVVQLDRSPAPGLQSHWVVLVAQNGSDYLMLDPWPFPADAGPVSLLNRYAFGRQPQDFITAAVWYQNQTAPAPVPSNPPPVGPGFYIQVPPIAGGGINLRSAPSTTASIVLLEAPGIWLTSLETAASAGAKIGVQGQWINVQDPSSNRGYVAGWLVQGPPGFTPPAPAAPTPAPAPSAGDRLTVVVSAAANPTGLRLRDQPGINGNVLATESAGAVLTVLEAAAAAQAKIGVQDQWLNVQDSGGLKGYVAAWYVQPAGSAPAAPAPAASASAPVSPAAGLTVVVSDAASAGLRLRSQPNALADTLSILSPGTHLAVVEPAAAALAKIGVNGQWLYVRGPDGTAGYVAAWFVQKAG